MEFQKINTMMTTAASVIILLLSASCAKDPEFIHPAENTVNTNTPDTRVESQETRRVLLLYSCGFSNISSSLKDDIEELTQGYVPEEGRDEDVLLVYSHQCKINYNYNIYTEPVLFRAFCRHGEIIRDTVKTWPKGTVSADSRHFKEVLEYVRDEFKASEYDMVFSSHATGWLPLEREDETLHTTAMPGGPQKVIGATVLGSTQYWMDINNFANAIPDDMNLNCIMMDCCLAGCVEVAYELKDKCKFLVFSPTEILLNGFDYKNLFGHLFPDGPTDPIAVAKDYFAQYYPNSYATISVADCSKMEELAECCRKIISNHAGAIRSLKKDGVQQYWTLYEHRFLYDLRDIFLHAGVSESELNELDNSLSKCILYEDATARFHGEGGGFAVKTHCGLSCYLPSTGTSNTDKKYRELSWNKVTGLIE